MSFPGIAAGIQERQRLSVADGMVLLSHPNLTELGLLADQVRQRLVPGGQASYSRQYGLAGVGLRDYGILAEEARIAVESGAAEICLLADPENAPAPDWPGAMQVVRSTAGRPVTLSTPASTIARIARTGGFPLSEAAARLKGAGLDLVGPEAAFDAAPILTRPDELIAVHRTAHEAGLPSIASLPGTAGASAQVQFLLFLRSLQDETGGLLAVATGPIVFRSGGDPLVPAPGGPESVSSFRYLQLLAAARLMLDNVPHVRAAWETQGLKIGQVALRPGADDLGAAHAAYSGAPRAQLEWTPASQELERQIRDAGLSPWLRNGEYEVMPDRRPGVSGVGMTLRVLGQRP